MFFSVSGLQPKGMPKMNKGEDDDLWGAIAAPAPISTSKPLSSKKTEKMDDDDDPWGAVAAPAPRTSSIRPSTAKSGGAAVADDDPWAAIAAPPPTTRAKPLSSAGRGRGAKTTALKLGAQRINRTSSGM